MVKVPSLATCTPPPLRLEVGLEELVAALNLEMLPRHRVKVAFAATFTP